MPSTRLPVPSVLVVLLVLCVPLAGCGGVLVADASPPDGGTAAERYRAIDTVEATVVTTVENESGTTTRRAELVRRPSTGESRRETVAPAADRGDLVVSNGSMTWMYDESAGNVTRIDASGVESGAGGYAEYLSRLFDAVHANDSTGGDVGISPLPVVPGTDRPAPATNGTVGRFDVSYEGTAEVDGRTAHVLELTPHTTTDDGFAVENQTLYLDTEHLYPLRQRMSYRFDGNRTRVTVTHRNVSFDGDAAADRFTFDPPANATVDEVPLPETTRYDSVGALRANTTLDVPSPDLPDGFALKSATHTVGTDRPFSGVTLSYSNGSASVFVATYNRTDPFGEVTGPSDGEAVRLGDRNATYGEYGTAKSVTWSCREADMRYSVSTDALSRDALLEIARSLDCGDGR